MKKFVPINNVLLVVADEVGDTWTGDQPVYEKWIKTAIGKINSKCSFDFVFKLRDVKHQCNVCLDDDTQDVIGLTPGNYIEQCNNVFQSMNSGFITQLPPFIPGNTDFGNGYLFIDHGKHGLRGQCYGWDVKDGTIIFHDKIQQSQVTTYEKQFKRDHNGSLMILETDVDAAAAYVLLMKARRSKWGPKEHRMSDNEIRVFEARWATNMGDARAKGSKMSASRQEEYAHYMASTIRTHYTSPQ